MGKKMENRNQADRRRQERRRRAAIQRRRAKKRAMLIGLVLLLVLLVAFLVKKKKKDRSVPMPSDQTQEEKTVSGTELFPRDPKVGQKPLIIPEGIAKGTSLYPYVDLPDFLQAQAYVDLPPELRAKCDKYPEAKPSILKYDQWKKHPPVISADHVRYVGKFPNAIQWDPMWGFTRYGQGWMAVNGCGPTTFSNIVVGLTGKRDFTPYEAARYCEKHKYSGTGTFASLFDFGLEDFGLRSRRIVFNEKILQDELKKGNVVCILSAGGTFAIGNHYVFIQGKDADGYIVNDPNSPKNTDQRWSFQSVHQAASIAWAIGK